MILCRMRSVLIAVSVALLAFDSRAEEVSGVHVILPSLPAAPGPIDAMPALHEGLQLTYATITTTVPGNVEEVIASMPGTIEDPDSGITFFTKQRKFTGAAGPQQTTVSRIDGDKVICAYATFLSSSAAFRGDAPPQLAARFSGVQPVGENTLIGGQWLTPAQLDDMARTPPQGCKVGRAPFKEGDHTFNAITFSCHLPSAQCYLVYDPQTGFLIHRTVISQGPPSLNVLPGVTPRGDVMFRFMDLLAVRDLGVPWADEPMPDWVGQMKVLHLAGGKSSKGPGGARGLNMPPIPWGLNISLTEQGNGWAHTLTSITVANKPTSSKLDEVWGPAQFGGLWAGPKALAMLQLNQVLDQDPVTQMKTLVTSVDNKSIVISEMNTAGESDWTYDKTTGMLVGRRVIQRIQLPTPRTDTEEEHFVSKE